MPRQFTTPKILLTDGAGPNQRLRVEEGRHSFFKRYEFRTFKEWSAPTTATYVVKAVVPLNIILMEFGITMEEGKARIETLAGGTPSGTFDEILPVLSTNTMDEFPVYAPQVVLTAGGAIPDGFLLDVLRAKTSDNSNFSSSVGENSGAERGIGVGTYHFRITLTAAVGVLKARWEERP